MERLKENVSVIWMMTFLFFIQVLLLGGFTLEAVLTIITDWSAGLLLYRYFIRDRFCLDRCIPNQHPKKPSQHLPRAA